MDNEIYFVQVGSTYGCSKCGAATPDFQLEWRELHINWHAELDAQIARAGEYKPPPVYG